MYRREGLAPPSLSTFREVYSSLAQQLTSPAFFASLGKSGELGRIGVYGLQAYGVFKVRFGIFFVSRTIYLLTRGVGWRDFGAEERCWIQARVDRCVYVDCWRLNAYISLDEFTHKHSLRRQET